MTYLIIPVILIVGFCVSAIIAEGLLKDMPDEQD